MFLKKVLNQPNLVGTMLIALMVCAGFVYAFAFNGFNVETTTGGEVEAWLAAAGGGSSGGSGGGGAEDTPPENPPQENPPQENPPQENPPQENPPQENPPQENPPQGEDGEGDPPGNEEQHPVPEGDPPGCDCDSSGEKNVKRCDCGGQDWNADVGIWTNPCKSKIKVYPCPGNKNGNKCKYRHEHTGTRMKRKNKEWHCPCDNHPLNSSRNTWKICKDSNSTACKGKCKDGNRK